MWLKGHATLRTAGNETHHKTVSQSFSWNVIFFLPSFQTYKASQRQTDIPGQSQQQFPNWYSRSLTQQSTGYEAESIIMSCSIFSAQPISMRQAALLHGAPKVTLIHFSHWSSFVIVFFFFTWFYSVLKLQAYPPLAQHCLLCHYTCIWEAIRTPNVCFQVGFLSGTSKVRCQKDGENPL